MKYNTLQYLSICCAVIDEYGYIPSRNGGGATVTLCKNIYKYLNGEDVVNAKRIEDVIDDLNITLNVTPEGVGTYYWIKKYSDNNDYFLKIKNILSKDELDENELGIVTSFPASYKREIERQEAIKNSSSEFVGTVGGKVNVKVKNYKLVSSFDTAFGTMFIHQFEDYDGNVFIWKTGIYIDEAPDMISGTVKEHATFNGIKQTVLTRCKIS